MPWDPQISLFFQYTSKPIKMATFRGPELLDAWASDEVLGAIRAYVDRTLRK